MNGKVDGNIWWYNDIEVCLFVKRFFDKDHDALTSLELIIEKDEGKRGKEVETSKSLEIN